MAKGSRKKRRPADGGGAKKKKAPIGKEGGDAPASPSVPSTTSAEGDKKRPGDDSEGITATSAAPGKRARGCEAGSSTGSSAQSLGKGAGGMPAAADAAATDDAAVKEEVQASIEGEGSKELASSPPSGGVESVTVPQSGAAAGLEHEPVSNEELDASICSEMDEWIAVDGDGSALEGKATPLQPQQEDDAHGNAGCRIREDERIHLLASTSSASAAAAAIVDGGKEGAGKTRDQAAILSLQTGDGEGIGIGTEVEERPAKVEAVPEKPTARPIAEKVRVDEAGESSEPQGGAGAKAAPTLTAAPLLDVGAATPIAVRESPLESGSNAAPYRAQAGTASSTALSNLALEEGSKGNAPDRPDIPAIQDPLSTKDTPADTVGGAIAETRAAAAAAATAAATTVSMPSPSKPSRVAITAGSALQAAGRDSVDGVEEPQPPPSAALAVTTGDGAIGTCPASDASKDDAAVGGAVGSQQKITAVAEVLPEPAPASSDAVIEGATALTSTGDSSREKAAAAKAAAEAATAAAVLASADAASKGVSR